MRLPMVRYTQELKLSVAPKMMVQNAARHSRASEMPLIILVLLSGS